VFDTHLVLNRRSWVRFRRKLHKLESAWEAGMITEAELQTRATALAAFTRTPGLSAWHFRDQTVQGTPVSGREARTG
jgi:hypothetical protein